MLIGAVAMRPADAIGQVGDPNPKPVVYLTFDDGPSENDVTDRIQAVLAAKNAKATFFVLGEQVQKNPNRIAGLVAGGHAVGHHGWDHKNLTLLDAAGVAAQFDGTQREVTAAGGPAMACYRPPYLGTNSIVLAAATSRNLTYVGVTADSKDYLDPKPTAAQMVANILKTFRTTATAAEAPQTVIFHDGYANQAPTIAGLTLFLNTYGDKFDFRTHQACTPATPIPDPTPDPIPGQSGPSGKPWPVTGCNYATAPHPPTGFVDVAAGQFYSDPVAWAKASAITNGLTPTTFGPSKMVTRAQMAAFLHRMVCEAKVPDRSGFSDVANGEFYSTAVDWLKAEGITTGTTATTYSPSAAVNRAQMAAFLWRMAGSPAGSPDAGFSDVPDGEFYSNAVDWLKAEGITTGTTATTYAPNQVVTRAEMATFLFRLASSA